MSDFDPGQALCPQGSCSQSVSGLPALESSSGAVLPLIQLGLGLRLSFSKLNMLFRIHTGLGAVAENGISRLLLVVVMGQGKSVMVMKGPQGVPGDAYVLFLKQGSGYTGVYFITVLSTEHICFMYTFKHTHSTYNLKKHSVNETFTSC